MGERVGDGLAQGLDRVLADVLPSQAPHVPGGACVPQDDSNGLLDHLRDRAPEGRVVREAGGTLGDGVLVDGRDGDEGHAQLGQELLRPAAERHEPCQGCAQSTVDLPQDAEPDERGLVVHRRESARFAVAHATEQSRHSVGVQVVGRRAVHEFVVVLRLAAVGVQQVDLVRREEPITIPSPGVAAARDALGLDVAGLGGGVELGDGGDDDLYALEVLDLDVGPHRRLERVVAERGHVVADLGGVEARRWVETVILIETEKQLATLIVAERRDRLPRAPRQTPGGRLGFNGRQVSTSASQQRGPATPGRSRNSRYFTTELWTSAPFVASNWEEVPDRIAPRSGGGLGIGDAAALAAAPALQTCSRGC